MTTEVAILLCAKRLAVAQGSACLLLVANFEPINFHLHATKPKKCWGFSNGGRRFQVSLNRLSGWPEQVGLADRGE